MSRLLLIALLSPFALAQTPPVLQLNAQNLVVTGQTGYAAQPNRLGYQFTPTQNLVIRAAETCTAIATGGFMRFEILTNGATNLPASQLARGGFQVDADPNARWQGCNLDRPVSLVAGTPYWFVWNDPGASLLPQPTSGATYLTVARYDSITDTWATPGSIQALPLRLYSGLLDRQGVAPWGSPCAGQLNRISTLFTNEDPTVGNATFRLEGCHFNTGGLAFLGFGFQSAFPSVVIPGTPVSSQTPAGCFQHVEFFGAITGIAGSGDVRASTLAWHVAFPLPVPAQANLQGVFFTAQIAGVDQGNTVDPLPLVTSNALHITLR